jgi:hypothetical protein
VRRVTKSPDGMYKVYHLWDGSFNIRTIISRTPLCFEN